MTKLAHRLFWKYTRWMSLVVGAAVLLSGSVQAVLKYRETSTAVARLHALESHKVAAKINPFIGRAVDELRATLSLLDTGHVRDSRDLKVEAYRLLRRSPAIAEVRYLDARGIEEIHVSRFGLDQRAPGKDYSGSAAFLKAQADVPHMGEVYFYKDSEPRTTIALRAKGSDGGVLSVELNLKHILQVIETIKVGTTGFAYVVEEKGRLIAHPDIGTVLGKSDISHLSHVRFALGADSQRPTRQSVLHESSNAQGQPVVVSFSRLDVPSWTLFIEQQRHEAYAPLIASLEISGLVLVGALLIGVVASAILARQVTKPIAALHAGAEIIGSGNLDYRIQLAASDELGDLGAQFNRMAERLRDSQANLERKVEERTHAVATANRLIEDQAKALRMLNDELERKLAEAAAQKEAAERANAAKTRFLASASHDLRQPMHSIGLLVGLLDHRLHLSEMRSVVDKIRASVQAMEELFSSLLDISKLDSDIIKPNLQEFDIGDLLLLVHSNYCPQARERGLDFRCVPSSAAVKSDPVLLERILGNLVANAIRYTERGRVLLGCRRRPGSLEVQVWDTGIGIPEAHLDDIFEEFFQLGNPERDRDKGLGLGLSIVKRSAELLNHPLVVKSRVGSGSMFGVALPMVSRAKARPVGESTPRLAGSLRGAFVVIIDDDRQSGFAMEASFRACGCHTLSAVSANDAINELRQHLRAPDLIVSDYRLRDQLNGLQAIRDLRSIAETDIPGIIVTGDITVADLDHATMQGLVVLHKPVSPERLLDTAAQLIDAAQAKVV